MKKMINNIKSFFSIFRKLFYILDKQQKRQGVCVAFNMLIVSFLDTLGVAAILPFISALTEIETVKCRWYTKWFMNFFHISSDTGLMVAIGVGIICLYIVKNLYSWLYQCMLIKYQCCIQHDLSVIMLKSYMSRPYSFFRNTNSSIIQRGIDADVVAVYNVISNVFTLVSQTVTIILISLFLLRQDVEMAVALLIAGIICVVVLVLVFKKKITLSGNEFFKSNSARISSSYQIITGIKEIYVMQRRENFISQYDKAYGDYTHAMIEKNKVNAAPIRVVETIFVSIVIGMVCIKLMMGMNPVTYVPQLATFAVAGFRMLPMLTAIPSCTNELIFYYPMLSETYGNISQARERKNSKFDNTIDDENEYGYTFNQSLCIKNVSYCYEDGIKNVLDNLNLEIKKGEMVGVIGESGAGKSTLAEIIMGLDKPTKGAIVADNRDIYAMPKAWSKTIGYIPQTVFMIDSTIRNNVTFGIDEDEISDKKVWDALRKARIEDFVRSLPDGLDTMIGERGIKFSGGQRQRVAIARALYYDPAILVMDEATSALDSETETAVMESINDLQGKKTLIIIAHRLTTIKRCDKIYVIEDGKAVLKSKKDVFGGGK